MTSLKTTHFYTRVITSPTIAFGTAPGHRGGGLRSPELGISSCCRAAEVELNLRVHARRQALTSKCIARPAEGDQPLPQGSLLQRGSHVHKPPDIPPLMHKFHILLQGVVPSYNT